MVEAAGGTPGEDGRNEMRLSRFLTVLCVLVVAAPAFGASRKDHDDCNANDADRNIAGCTRIAEDPSESDKVRGIAYVGRGLAWQQKGIRDTAMRDFSEAIRLNPNDSLAFSNRGILWRELNDVDRAIADFTEAIRLDPQPRSDIAGSGHVNIYANRGLAYLAKGDGDRALADFDQAIARDPKDADATYYRAQVHLSKRDLDRAVADLDAVIRLDPSRTQAWYVRGAIRYEQYMSASAYIEAKDLDGAIADFTEVIRRDPENVNAHYARALAFNTNGERDRAIADLTEAVRLNPFNRDMIAVLKQFKPDYQPPANPVGSLLDEASAPKKK
jgi:tetratricopeptide (TPR) repeat protein